MITKQVDSYRHETLNRNPYVPVNSFYRHSSERENLHAFFRAPKKGSDLSMADFSRQDYIWRTHDE